MSVALVSCGGEDHDRIESIEGGEFDKPYALIELYHPDGTVDSVNVTDFEVWADGPLLKYYDMKGVKSFSSLPYIVTYY